MNHAKRLVRLTHLLVFIGACFTGAGLSANQKSGEVRVLRSDERSFMFEYVPKYSGPQTIISGSQEFVQYDFEGSIPAYSDEATGAPDLRFKRFPFGFPSESGNTLQVIASDYEDVPNVVIAPVPSFKIHEEMVVIDTYRIVPARYGENAFLPGKVAELSDVGRVRSLIVGNVRVFPVQYNPASQTLRRYSRILIEVIYGEVSAPRVQNQDDVLFKDALLNYDIARFWKSRPFPPASVTPSVLATGPWYRITVSEDGIYRLDAQYLSNAGVDVSSIDPRTIRIHGNGGTEVPENIALPRPIDLVENAIYVEGEADGQFNSGDYILFYGKSPRGWNYNAAARTFNHYINHYTEVNHYWLTFGGANGRRMADQQSLPDIPTVIPDRFTDLVLIENEMVNLVRSGKDWHDLPMNSGTSRTYATTLHGLVQGDPILYRYNLVSNQSCWFFVREGNTLFDSVSINSPGGYLVAQAKPQQAIGTITGTQSLLNFSYSAGISGTGWIDWVEIIYPRRFEAVNNQLRFRSPDTTGIVEYRLEAFGPNPQVFNVTRFDDVRRITGLVGTYQFRSTETSGQISEYCAATVQGFKTPSAITRLNNQDLRGYAPPDSVDFIIVTSPEYWSAANRLKAFREQPEYGNLRTLVVDVNQIYNEFGGGIPDITAIRDYLKHSYDKWNPRLRFVLFFGQASYDYKGRLGSRSSYVPTWQGGVERNDVYSYSTDDFFVMFGLGSARPFLVSGRLSARSSQEADILVDKLIRYETSSSRDGWSTRMLFVADDRIADGLESFFSADHAKSVVGLTPNEFDKRQIYTGEYPTVISQGRRKPGAYQAIIDEINRGVLAVNYAGHGNPGVWAHESIFVVQTSIPQLVNADKLAVFYAATCNFSQSDDPGRRTGSEFLMNKSDGGAIAAVSATRKVFANENRYLHEGIFLQMFRRDQFGRLLLERPATAMFLFKGLSNSDNSQKFFFMGDPTMRFQFPKGFAAIDSINGDPMDGGATPAQLKALARVTVTGTIRDTQNQPEPNFTGVSTLIVNDASRLRTYTEEGSPFTYTAPGGTIFRGQNSVRDGMFTAVFVVPKDIAYADSTTRGRMLLYFSNDSGDGIGYTGNVHVGGTDSSAVNDAQGPGISIFLDSRGFRSGDVVSEDPDLLVDLADSNGINTSVTGIGHRIEAWLNNSAQSTDMTEFYSSKLDNYREGTVQYKLKGLPLGRNSVRVRAWDTFNNSSVAETFFEVASSDQLKIIDLFNYPNPFSGGTSFTFRQNQLSPLNVAVKVYTLAGRLIQNIEFSSSGEPFIRIPWDGRDRDGDVLANGVYLYKVTVKTMDGRFTSEAISKLSVLK